MSSKHPSVRPLHNRPDLAQLKRQAKELLKAFSAGDAAAVAEVNAYYQGAHAAFALHDAQLVLARSYGFGSWPKLKAYVDGVTVRRLADAVRAGDLAAVRSMLAARPELANFCMAEDDEHRALHYAVLERRPEIVRVLMQHGADPHVGIWPHRDATSALTLATERGLVAHAARLLADDAAGRTPETDIAGSSVAQELLWGAIDSASLDIVRMALERIDWPRNAPRWHLILQNGLYLGTKSNRPAHVEAFRLVLDRCDPDVRSKRGVVLLHDVAASRGGLTATDRVAFASLLLRAGARLDLRDDLLRSTPLGWACRWGRIELVKLLMEHGADPIETAAEPWATPMAWAVKMRRSDVVAELQKHPTSFLKAT